MKIPKGMTEQQVLDVIENVAKRLAGKFKFGYHDMDDMRQQARMFAWEGLGKYDGKRPLENFLWTHVRNRLFNEKRNKFARPDKPCLSCPLYDPHCVVKHSQCEEYDDKEECKLYAGWIRRNSTKKNLMLPIDLNDVEDEFESNMRVEDTVFEKICEIEIGEILDREMPVNLRSDYLKFKYELKLQKNKRDNVVEAIRKILKEHNLD